MSSPLLAPALEVSGWLNTPRPIALSDFLGRVLVIDVFQMLCPGCVEHGLPQAKRIAATFSPEDVAVIGLHSVFEHHDVQGTEAALAAFVHEYRIDFPVAIDKPDPASAIPRTMAAYAMQGTPTLILIDRQGRARARLFGRIPDLQLGAQIQSLLGEAVPAIPEHTGEPTEGCTPDGCTISSN